MQPRSSGPPKTRSTRSAASTGSRPKRKRSLTLPRPIVCSVGSRMEVVALSTAQLTLNSAAIPTSPAAQPKTSTFPPPSDTASSRASIRILVRVGPWG